MVFVGYATPAGFAWLAERTEGRAVRVLVGDARPKYWKGSKSHREAAAEFVRRDDVEVRNWYTKRARQGPAEAHLKAWLVCDGETATAVLHGSANLTHKGLYRNVETMAEAHGDDMARIDQQARELWDKGWDMQGRLLGYLGTGSDTRQRPSAPATQSAPVPVDGRHVVSDLPHGATRGRRRACLHAWGWGAGILVALIVVALAVVLVVEHWSTIVLAFQGLVVGIAIAVVLVGAAALKRYL